MEKHSIEYVKKYFAEIKAQALKTRTLDKHISSKASNQKIN